MADSGLPPAGENTASPTRSAPGPLTRSSATPPLPRGVLIAATVSSSIALSPPFPGRRAARLPSKKVRLVRGSRLFIPRALAHRAKSRRQRPAKAPSIAPYAPTGPDMPRCAMRSQSRSAACTQCVRGAKAPRDEASAASPRADCAMPLPPLRGPETANSGRTAPPHRRAKPGRGARRGGPAADGQTPVRAGSRSVSCAAGPAASAAGCAAPGAAAPGRPSSRYITTRRLLSEPMELVATPAMLCASE